MTWTAGCLVDRVDMRRALENATEHVMPFVISVDVMVHYGITLKNVSSLDTAMEQCRILRKTVEV